MPRPPPHSPSLLDVDAVASLTLAHDTRLLPQLVPTLRAAIRLGNPHLPSVLASMSPRPPAEIAELLERFPLPSSSVVESHATSTRRGFKLVVRLHDGQLVETVAIVHEAEGGRSGRVTVCVSSQVGCKMGCTFCATGTLGWAADLSVGEIVEQIWHVERHAPQHAVWWRVTNVVFMGMGEPLNNYGAVVGACRVLQQLWDMSPARITISTVGVVSRIRTLASDLPGIRLAISLHAATQERRLQLVPSSSAYSVDKIIQAMDNYIERSGQSVMIEFILIEGVNAQLEEADALGALLSRRNVYINLIPYNHTSAGQKLGYATPSDETLRAFALRLSSYEGPPGEGGESKLRVNVRWSTAYGRSVDGACGQLALVQYARQGKEGERRIEGAAGNEGAAGKESEVLCVGTAKERGKGDGVLPQRRAEWGGWREWLFGGTPLPAEEEGVASSDGGNDIEDAGRSAPVRAVALERGQGGGGRREVVEQSQLDDGIPLAWLPSYAYQSHQLREGRARELRSLLAAALELSELERAHLAAKSSPSPPIQHAMQLAGHRLPPEARKRGTASWLASSGRRKFLEAFRLFVRQDVLPLLDDGSGKCVYQAEPTIRISFPGSRTAGGPPRADIARFHQPAEITFWIALTHQEVLLGSTPLNESLMEVVPLSPCECASWWGHRLAYGSAAAQGEASTVSLSFHVVPWSLYQESRENSKRSSHNLRLGGYYAVMDAAAFDLSTLTDK